MKFVEAILTNNSTDDHCREFVTQKGLEPLMSILGLPNLPIDFPTSPACQTVAIVCKSILVSWHTFIHNCQKNFTQKYIHIDFLFSILVYMQFNHSYVLIKGKKVKYLNLKLWKCHITQIVTIWYFICRICPESLRFWKLVWPSWMKY